MTYVDGFVLPLPEARVAEYREIAAQAGRIWKEHGALEYRECVGEDLEIEDITTFPAGIGTKTDETVVFAYIVYESRKQRDEVNAKVMSDPRMEAIAEDMPFDVARMMYGGFETVVEI